MSNSIRHRTALENMGEMDHAAGHCGMAQHARTHSVQSIAMQVNHVVLCGGRVRRPSLSGSAGRFLD